jgi:uncharacterized protein YbjT (DUF2867 family)
MRILLTGATGYIGKRVLPVLLAAGHEVICCVRNRNRFAYDGLNSENIRVLEIDFLDIPDPTTLPGNIDAAYYLIHSMSASISVFEDFEAKTARNFRMYMDYAGCKQVVYLSGLAGDKELSRHMASRRNVETILREGNYSLTTLRAGIIVGSGSASFEIIRDLVEKLPIMITPEWVNTRTQPVAIRNVVAYLTEVLHNSDCMGKTFEIGGPDIITYKRMLLGFAKVRGLKRMIVTVPVMTPRLSSYWLYFVTSTSYKLAVNLVNSMKVEVVCSENIIREIFPEIRPIPYEDALRMAFSRIEHEEVASSWKDSLISSRSSDDLSVYAKVPQNGCFIERKEIEIDDPEGVIERIWSIGGDTGWYYASWLWRVRGLMDKIAGGVGLNRGRTNPHDIHTGDSIDFWRVLAADKVNGRLLLFAEMKVPGEAWLEFKISGKRLIQTATFRPKGLMGRLYWFSTVPLHFFVFRGMLEKISGRGIR